MKLLWVLEESRGRRRRIDKTRASVDSGGNSHSHKVFEARSIEGSGLSIHFEHRQLFCDAFALKPSSTTIYTHVLVFEIEDISRS